MAAVFEVGRTGPSVAGVAKTRLPHVPLAKWTTRIIYFPQTPGPQTDRVCFGPGPLRFGVGSDPGQPGPGGLRVEASPNTTGSGSPDTRSLGVVERNGQVVCDITPVGISEARWHNCPSFVVLWTPGPSCLGVLSGHLG